MIGRWVNNLWTLWGGWPARLAAWGCLALSFGYFLVVGLIMWKGGVWAYIIYAERPMSYLAGGLLSLFGWYYLRHGYRNDGKAWRLFLGRALLLAFSAAISIAAGEIALRLILMQQQRAQSFTNFQKTLLKGRNLPVRSTHPMAHIIQPSLDKRLVFELRPELDFDFGHRRVRTSRQGFREDRDYPLERAPNSVRIVGLGDSGMFGWNLEQNENYMDVLETRLQGRSDGVLYEVLNMAVPGYNTSLEFEMLRSKGLAFRPDIVVVGWCENDFQLPFFLLESENFMRRDASYLYTLMFNRSNLVEIIAGERIRDLRSFDEQAVSPAVRAGADITGVERALRSLKELAEQHGFHVLVFGPMNGSIVGICQNVDVPYYNTRERIPRDRYPSEWAIYFMHPAAEGHQVLAEYLEKELEDRGWLQPKNLEPNS